MKAHIVNMAVNGSGIRDTARVLKINQCPVLSRLNYAVAVLGDSHYGDKLLSEGQQLDGQLKTLGAYQLSTPLLIDASSYYPDAEITAWGVLLANHSLLEAA